MKIKNKDFINLNIYGYYIIILIKINIDQDVKINITNQNQFQKIRRIRVVYNHNLTGNLWKTYRFYVYNRISYVCMIHMTWLLYCIHIISEVYFHLFKSVSSLRSYFLNLNFFDHVVPNIVPVKLWISKPLS